MKKDIMNKQKNTNKGFSFIEVLLAVVILGLVAAPILQIFITSAKVNDNSKRLMAATDVATITLEDINSCKFDGTGGAKEKFTNTATIPRIEALGYTTVAMESAGGDDALNVVNPANPNQPDYEKYVNYIISHVSVTTGNTGIVYVEHDSSLGVAMYNVEYNNYTFDTLIWFEPTTDTSGKYYTYDVKVAVYEDREREYIDPTTGETETEYIDFGEMLISVDGAVANK